MQRRQELWRQIFKLPNKKKHETHKYAKLENLDNIYTVNAMRFLKLTQI